MKNDGQYQQLLEDDDELKEPEESLSEKDRQIIDEKEALKELAVIFDNSSMEIYCLLGDSFTRFVTTESYQILLKKRKHGIKQWIKKRTASVVSLTGNR